MNLKVTDIIGIGLASVLLFPVIFFAVLLGSGTAHLEFGENTAIKEKLAGYLEKISPQQKESDLEQSRLYEANLKKQQELATQEELVKEEISRLEALKAENAQFKDSISQDRQKIETLVGENRQLSDQRIDELAQVYGSMKPVEAAPILLNLQDTAISRIIKKMPETRGQAKIMAAIGAMDSKRAAQITQILGWRKPE